MKKIFTSFLLISIVTLGFIFGHILNAQTLLNSDLTQTTGTISNPPSINTPIINNTVINSPTQTVIQQPVTCVESWTCLDWSSCNTESKQTRICKDVNTCGTTLSKPETIQDCVLPVCNYTYSDWSVCTDSGIQSRTVISGGTQVNCLGEPILTQTCNYIPVTIIQPSIEIQPQKATIYIGEKLIFKALINGLVPNNIVWIVAEEKGGTISDSGVYTAPLISGIFHVIAKDPNNTSNSSVATITVRLQSIINDISTTTVESAPVITPTSTPTTTKIILPIIKIENPTSTVGITPSLPVVPGVSNTIATKTSETIKKPVISTESGTVLPATTSNVVSLLIASTTKTETSLYKDSNKDGISDFDSINVYNIDPIKSSPTTVLNGKKINAAEKVLLGFDPTKEDLVKIIPEEPNVSRAEESANFKVEEVKLNVDKKVTITGKALPNSFVTVYIYSTPIIVTVKTDNNGDWQYTLNQELDNGKHTIYTATVNNSGKILAKSTAFNFIKTAEAATLESLPLIPVSPVEKKPTILNNIYIIVGFFIVLVLFMLVLIGIISQKNTENLPPANV